MVDNKIFFNRSLRKTDIQLIIKRIKDKKIETILITGSTGVGKTTLAKYISEQNKIKHIQVDKLYWTAQKGAATNPNFITELKKELSITPYIIEGLWKYVKEQKSEDDFDLHIHLSLPNRVQLIRLFTRDLKEFILGRRKTSDFFYFLKNHL